MGEHWSDFFVAEVGATAALAGLLFVGISINLQRILELPRLPARAAEMLIVLFSALLVCSIVLIPNQPPRLLGAEIGVIGLAMWAVPMTIQVRSLLAMKGQPVSWWLGRMVLTQMASLPIVIGGALLFFGDDSGFYWLAAGILATMTATILNAWVLLIEIMR